MPKHAVFDIDDTIADLSDVFISNLQKYAITKVKPCFSYDDNYTRSILDPSLGVKTKEDWIAFMQSHIITKEDFKNFKPVPGSLELVRDIYQLGWTIDFCSRVVSYADYPEIKFQWLNKYLGDLKWDLIIVRKDRSKRFLNNADYVIDDNVQVCIELDNVIMPVKPWNEAFVHNNQVRHFESFSELGIVLGV